MLERLNCWYQAYIAAANLCRLRTFSCCGVMTAMPMLLLGGLSSAHGAWLQLLTSFFQSLSVLRPPDTTTFGDEGPDVAKLLMFCSSIHHKLPRHLVAVPGYCGHQTNENIRSKYLDIEAERVVTVRARHPCSRLVLVQQVSTSPEDTLTQKEGILWMICKHSSTL
jgi:hypothetical protein